jgi:23S rRNA (guanine745-N1)-methyltransferase
LLLCPVRDCHQPLHCHERSLACEQGHSFDIAKSGYINLLQPQDKKAKNPGDSKDAALARRRLHERGTTEPLLQGLSELLAASASDVVLDAGCGDGFYLGSLAQRIGFAAHGVDLSIPAIDAAARKYKTCEWVVANADRFLPYSEASFSRVMSITARMNPPEFRRVLREDGRLLVAIPAPDDLIELRGIGRDRAERTLNEFGALFTLLSIYRPLRSKPVEAMRLTFSLDVLLFTPRS